MPSKKSPVAEKKRQVQNAKKQQLKRNKQDSDSEDSEFELEEEEESEYETVSESESSDSSYRPKKSKRRAKDEDEEDEEDEEEDEEDDEEDDGEDEDDDEEEMSHLELQKFISRVFPSKYMDDKVKRSKKEAAEKKNKKDSKKKSSATQKKKNKKQLPTKKSSKLRRYKDDKKKKSKRAKDEKDEDEEDDDEEDDDESGSVDEDESATEEEDESGSDDEEEDEDGVYNIIFSIGNGEQDDDCYNKEADDDECNSDDEQTFMKETYEPVKPDAPGDAVTTDEGVVSKTSSKKDRKSSKANKKSTAKDATATDLDELTDVEKDYLEFVETKKQLMAQFNKKPKNKILRNAIRDCDASIKKLVQKARARNAKAYHKLIHSDKKRTNEVDYFRTKLSNKEQLQVMRNLKEINGFINIDKPYRLALLDTKMPSKFKAIALQKLNVLRSMEPGDPEYYKIKNWVDTFMRVPFGIYKNLSVKMDDGLDVCHEFMENAKTTLDRCVFGLDDAKLQIMQMLGQWISNPSAMGTAIAIKGPMGTGKTTLVKEGISKILGREFAFIALGGAGDSSFLEGHSYTYEGSSWGKIIQIIIDSKCMNPVIYFDELDKISDTPRGEEIVGILTHLTDTSQNSQFHDKYFSDIDFDLSKCLFIFSYNDESKVNPILRDRMYRIQTKGYDAKEKVTIARNYLLPKIREQVNFAEEDIIIPDDTIQYIVSNAAFTKEESGVRNLKRCLEIIYTKLNLFRLVKPDAKLFGKDIDVEVTFPFTVTRKHVDIFIKNDENQNQSMLAMYV